MKKDTESSVNPPLVQSHPTVLQDKGKFPIKEILQDEKDQGRNGVSVILKSKTGRKVTERIKTVEEVRSRYPLKYSAKSSQQANARLDYCFKSPTDARRFVRKVNDILSGDIPRLVSVILIAEEDLGKF